MIEVNPRSYYTEQIKADKEQFEHEQSTHSIEYCLDLAIEAMERRDYPSAIHYLGRAIELSPNDTRPIKIRAELNIISKQYNEAKADIEYLLWLDPDDEDALSAKELVQKKIDYEKMLLSFPIYG